MDNNRTEETTVNNPSGVSRKPYTAPARMVVLGGVGTLVQSGPNSNNDHDGGDFSAS